MIFWIIFTSLFFVLFLFITSCAAKESNAQKSDEANEAAVFPFFVFIVSLIITISCCNVAKHNKIRYNDMAKNQQCYSVNDLKQAHNEIIQHKAHQGSWTSFYNGYEFPDISVNIKDEVDTTIQIVK